MNMPADWAIEEALKDYRKEYGNPKINLHRVKRDPKDSVSISIFMNARMIEKYEPHRKPVDTTLEIVRELYKTATSNVVFYNGRQVGSMSEDQALDIMLAKYKELHP